MGDSEVADRLRTALDMYDVGERMQRQRLRRTYPHLTEPEIDERMRAWRLQRPGAAGGDAPGRSSRRFG